MAADDGECRLRILAVDDDESYLRYVIHVLRQAGFEAEVARSGAAAIDRMHAGARIDLLLIDLAMPGIDGIETVRLIQAEARYPGLYTILLTSKDGTDVKLRALDSGLDDFLTKSSTEREIIAKVRSAARRLDLERQLHVENEELQALAFTDELTGIANRRALFHVGNEILNSGRVLTAVLLDLDRFKQINDTYGHLTGDRILADVAACLKAHTRFCDTLGRYGGDEFVLLLPDTEAEEARQIIDRLMSKIRQLTWTIDGAVLSISAQTGIATSGGADRDLRPILASCDVALYRAKQRRHEIAGARPELTA